MARNSLKAAPRRNVIRIERQGDWGEVIYLHHLACGHTENRKRKSSAPAIACSGCVTASEFAAGRLTGPTPTPLLNDELIDDLAGLETQAARVRANLAAYLRIGTDAVDVVVRADEIAYVLVFLDAAAALRLTSNVDTTNTG